MVEISLILKAFIVIYTISRFEPLHWALEFLPDNIISNMVRLLLTCSKCLSLYLGSIIVGDIFIGMALSLFFTIFEKTIGNWLNKVRLR